MIRSEKICLISSLKKTYRERVMSAINIALYVEMGDYVKTDFLLCKNNNR